MTLKSRIIDRGLHAAMVSVLYLVACVYSVCAKAQGSQQSSAGKSHDSVITPDREEPAQPLRTTLNSKFSELKPSLAPDGTTMYFSRAYHPGNILGIEDKEDIWVSKYSKISEIWSEPIRLSGYINNDGPNFINNVSVTGDTLFLGNRYGKNGKMSAGVSYTVNVNGKWSTPVNIEIKNYYNISDHANAYVATKAGVIIEAIQRDESLGGRDLYVSFWDGRVASEPLNMGNVINTEFEESSPFLAADNVTLFFASKGHNGMGGFDIYVTRRLDDTWTNWSEPKNLGSSVNGLLDEQFFSISHCGKYAVFTKQVSQSNEDVFKVPTDELPGIPARKQNKQGGSSYFTGL